MISCSGKESSQRQGPSLFAQGAWDTAQGKQPAAKLVCGKLERDFAAAWGCGCAMPCAPQHRGMQHPVATALRPTAWQLTLTLQVFPLLR